MTNEELDKMLCEKFPKIFRDRHGDKRKTAMCWGFEHGPGWATILLNLCSLIQSHVDFKRKTRCADLRFNRALARALNGDKSRLEAFFTHGTTPMTPWIQRQIDNAMTDRSFREVTEACSQVVATQVKEKFGTLRFYYSGGDDYVFGLVAMAEAMSASTCEECGDPGTETTGGWIKVRCQKHQGR